MKNAEISNAYLRKGFMGLLEEILKVDCSVFLPCRIQLQ